MKVFLESVRNFALHNRFSNVVGMETCTQNMAYLHLELLNSKWHFKKFRTLIKWMCSLNCLVAHVIFAVNLMCKQGTRYMKKTKTKPQTKSSLWQEICMLWLQARLSFSYPSTQPKMLQLSDIKHWGNIIWCCQWTSVQKNISIW